MGAKEIIAEKQAEWDANAEKKYRWIEEERKKHLINGDLPFQGEKEFYSGRNILVTGGTGFIGRVLIEKILRSIPDVGKIFVIVRTKRNQTPDERIAAVLNTDLFDLCRSQQPEALKKIVAIKGDMSLKGLGLETKDRELLENEVSVVFHGAATVRFDDPLRNAILLNTRGTHEIIELSKAMQNLKVFVHISTAYCNTDQDITLEKVYPTPFNWRHIIKLAETMSLEDLQALSHKLVGFQPNTYVFTKQLSEKIVDDARTEIPVIIVRPAVVVGALVEPIRGWTANLYGPTGFGVGIGKGVVRILFGNPKVHLNYFSVDGTAIILLATGWLRGTNTKISDDPNITDVINVHATEIYDSNYGDMVMSQPLMDKAVSPKRIRAPRADFTMNLWYYKYRLFTSHILFGILIDLFTMAVGQKPQLTRLYRRIHHTNMQLRYFMVRNYPMASCNVSKVNAWIMEPDLQLTIHVKLLESSIFQLKYAFKNLLKEDLISPAHRQVFEILHYIQQTLKYAIYAWLGWQLASNFWPVHTLFKTQRI